LVSPVFGFTIHTPIAGQVKHPIDFCSGLFQCAGMRLDRDPSLLAVIRCYGTAKRLADSLGITNRAVSLWKMVPLKHVKAVSEWTGIHPFHIRPDLYIQGFWNMQMNTAEMAQEMNIPEAEVCRYLQMSLANRTSGNAFTHPTLPAVSKQPMESDEGG